MAHTLVLLRHGQSDWNAKNLFTGWYDVDLTAQGEAEAISAGPAMIEAGVLPDIVHTSVQKRAIRTANLTLDAMDRAWIPVRRSWRLNERHYGDLTGKNKKETVEQFGADQVHIWRRSYDVPPPPLEASNPYQPNDDPRYLRLAPDVLPQSECLKDVVIRMLPWWYDAIVPDLRADRTVLVAAHGNSLRALAKHLDDISDDEIADLNIPTGVPVLYTFDQDMQPNQVDSFDQRYLGDVEAARAAAEAVAKQTG